jgi:ribosomal protein S18 acetylase RimI-like enzyme
MPELIAADPMSAQSQRVIRAYMDDVVSRYWRRPASATEVDGAMREFPSDALAPPAGLFVLAIADGEPVGCGGVQLKSDGIAELMRVWVAPAMRRRGVASDIVMHLEQEARKHGRTRMRLDTRHDLTEARALYARLGYREVARFNDAPYADHWFEKRL